MTYTGTLADFWRPGHGAIHQGVAFAGQRQRADFITWIGAAAAALAEVELWTNSPLLDWCEHHKPDMAALLAVVAGIARARGGQAVTCPAPGLPVLALILDFAGPVSAGDHHGIEQILAAGRAAAISVTLVLPARADRALDIVTPRARAQAYVLEPAGWQRAGAPGEGGPA